MKKNKAFTLIEILAVVTIIGLIFILVIPKITTSLKNKKSDVDTTTTNLVLSATKLYVSDHSSKFEKEDGNISCMPLHQLVKKGYLDGPVKNVTDDKDITNGKSVRITYNKGFKYELVNSNKCSVVYNVILKDKDGNKYKRLEYIESSGTQYLDTEYVFKNKPKVTGDIMITSGGDRDIMGTPIAKAGCFIIDFSGGTLYYRYSSSSFTRIGAGTQINNWHNIEFSDKVIVDGVEKGTIASYDFSSNTQSFLIGRGRNFGYARFKEIKMYDGDELVRDLVPCYRKIDNKIGMLDVINKIFYSSKTEEDFYYIKQEKQLPIEDTELNYIETRGSQYIDTDYVFKNKPKVVGKIMIMSDADTDIMGTAAAKDGCFIIDFSGNSGSTLWYRYSSASARTTNSGIDLIEWHEFDFSDKVFVDGIEKMTIASYDFSSNTQSFLIGRGRNYGYARFKEIKMYDGDELVRDLVPYYKKDINKVGMLDKVHNVFYENQGTGEFLWG